MTEPRPWRRALAWLLFLGPFFFLSYGFANWLASRRADVGAIVYDWERAIPFIPWTIVPYWSIDFLYAISLFVCTTRREVDRHAQRLLFCQVVAVTVFIAFPLRFTFERQAADGFFGALFTALGSFDKPFNQAPSLHIALLIVIWVRLAAHLSRTWRWVLHVWMTMIGLSVLTTYQHHFIDIPTGLAVGFLALWALPDEHPSPLTSWSFTSDPRRRRIAAWYGAGALLTAAVASLGGAWLWLLWLSIALAVVALNYAAIGAHGFQKGAGGRQTVGAQGLLAPYTALAWLNSRIWTRGLPRAAEVADGVFIGRIPGGDLARSEFAAVVDLSAELPCGAPAHRVYRHVPVLDLTVPTREHLREAADTIEAARAHGPVLVCCALGYSRSAAAVVAWLVSTGRAGNVDDAVEMVRKVRPSIVFTPGHAEVIGGLV